MSKEGINISEYSLWISDIKTKIKSAQTKIALSVNSAVLELYWEI